MKLAISAGITRGGIPDIPFIQQAEALGYHSVWTAETWGFDALSPLAYIAGQTKTIKLGTGIAHVDGRTPAMMAMTAQTIDRMAGGNRLLLGIGTSGPQVVEGWHGRPWGKPNYRLRDTVAIMRKIWSGDRVVHEGKEIQLPYNGPGSVGLGKPLKNIMHPLAEIPIYIGADTPLNVRMTGEVADGILAMHVTPRTVKDTIALLREGFAKRTDGKKFEDFAIKGALGVRLTDNVKAAIDAEKKHIALYAGGMGARSMNFHKEAMVKRGYGEAAERVQELFMAGHRQEAEAAVPDEYVEEEYLIGPAARITERYKAWRDCGLTHIGLRVGPIEVIELMAKVALR